MDFSFPLLHSGPPGQGRRATSPEGPAARRPMAASLPSAFARPACHATRMRGAFRSVGSGGTTAIMHRPGAGTRCARCKRPTMVVGPRRERVKPAVFWSAVTPPRGRDVDCYGAGRPPDHRCSCRPAQCPRNARVGGKKNASSRSVVSRAPRGCLCDAGRRYVRQSVFDNEPGGRQRLRSLRHSGHGRLIRSCSQVWNCLHHGGYNFAIIQSLQGGLG